MTSLNKAIFALPAIGILLVGAVVTTHIWATSLLALAEGVGFLLFVALFGVTMVLLPVALLALALLSWLEYRRGQVRGLLNRTAIVVGAFAGVSVGAYALSVWTGL